MASVLSVAGQVIKAPKDFGIEKYNITKSGRVASGDMVIELIAKKRKFSFSYDVISSVDLEKILTVIDGNEMLFELTYEENNVIKTATVYSGAIKAKKFREGSIWYWKSVTFDLIEQ